MELEIVTIGDELLLGLTIDTNGAWLARELAQAGLTVARRSTVNDRATEIASSVRDALERTGGVITTGGLGPTSDDLTKPAIAGIFGRELVFDERQWERLREMWLMRRRSEPPEVNRQQCMIPSGARVLTNNYGSAPGVFLEDERGRWVAMLPGVPREMRGLFVDELFPLLRERTRGGALPLLTRTVRTTGIAESTLPDKLGDAASGIGELELSYLPGAHGVDLRLTSRRLNGEAAAQELERGAGLIAERVGASVYTTELEDLSEVVLRHCRAHGHTIAVAESCTGGLLGARITAIPGSSDVFLGGVIAYDNQVKHGLLGVDSELLVQHGAVSEEVAIAMARGARERTGSTIGVGITGIAGPGGGSEEKPVGLVFVAVDVSGDVHSFGSRLIGDRDEIRFRATQAALDMIRRNAGPTTHQPM